MPSFAHAATLPENPGLVAVDGRTFPLRGASLTARADGGIAETTLRQEYANPYAEPLEVLYTMPLPADGAVVGYTFRLGERVVTGRIESLEQARETYRNALAQGRTAGLLEELRSSAFVQRLGNIPPGAAVSVEIRVLHRVAFQPAASRGVAAPGDDAEAGVAANAPVLARWEYRFPTVVGVRYQGVEGRVPDAGVFAAPRADASGLPARLDVELIVGDGGPEAAAVRSADGPLDVEADPRGTRVRLTGARLDRDVVIRWNAGAGATSARLVEGPGLPGDENRYALLSVTPPAVAGPAQPRDLTILVDASGSMDGAPLAHAKRIVEALLRSLARGDRFEIRAFSNQTVELTRGVREASEREIASALGALAALQAGGCTEMVAALDAALRPLRKEAQRQVILVTDGEIGFEREVVNSVLAGLPRGSRLHVAGVGSAPNRTLTHSASRAGRGIEVLVGLGDDPVEAGARLVRATAAPVLTDLEVAGSAVVASVPERPRDVFAGEPAQSFVALRPEGGAVRIGGTLPDGTRWEQGFDVPAASLHDDRAVPLGACFGRERVEDVEMRGGNAREIETIGLRHRIVTRRTSLVAVTENPTVDPRDPRRFERLALELPYGVSAEGLGLAAAGVMDVDDLRMNLDDLSYSAVKVRAARSSTAGRIGAIASSTLGKLSLGARRAGKIHGRVIGRDDDRLVVEFEAPRGGIGVPGASFVATILFEGRGPVSADVVFDESTSTGSIPEGLVVRWTLQLHETVARVHKPLGVVFELDGSAWTITLRRGILSRLLG
jgi:Ca-activated chloride channel family protein